jgi:hypothetical protein
MMQMRTDITLRRKGGGRRPPRYWLAALTPSVAIAALAVLAPVSAASAHTPHAQSAVRTPHVKVRLTRARSYCAAIKNGNHNAGAVVWLYKCTKANSDTWIEVDGVICNLSGQAICAEFIDPKSTNLSLCMAMNGGRKVVLQGCGTNGTDPPSQSEWIVDTGPENGWRDFAWGGMGDLAVLKVKDKEPLIGVDASAGCGGCWFHWTDN